jgi:cytochrome c oxidase subunit 2
MQEWLGMPVDASAHGAEIDQMTVIMHWIMLILFVGWGAFFLYTLIRFRRKRQAKANYAGVRSHFSSYLEGAVAVVEAALIIGFAVPLWAKRVNAFPAESASTIVRLVAEQFAWNAHYPGPDGIFGRTDIKLISAQNPLGIDRDDPAAKDDIVTINQLNLPINKPVIIYLTSKDVIHSFGVTYLRVKQDAIPGERIPVWFTPTKTNEQIQEELAAMQSIEGEQRSLERAANRVALVEYKDKSGEVIVSAGGFLGDDVIEELREAGIKDALVTRDFSTQISMREYLDAEGTVILAKGDRITDEAVVKLTSMGVRSILTAPDTPLEIACAQLCGLGHYRMRGFMTLQTESDFQAWLEEEASYLEH